MTRTDNRHLDGFDYVEYLKRHLFLGQIEPWSRNDHGRPIMALLCSVQDAIAECKEWSGQEIETGAFVDYLKQNQIVTGKFDHTDVDKERQELLGEPARPKLVGKLIAEYTAKLEQIADAINVSKRNIEKYDERIGQTALVGDDGYIYVDHTYWYVVPIARSKRHWTSIQGKLSFLDKTRHGESSGEFRAVDLPSEEQGETLRKVLGLRKRPT